MRSDWHIIKDREELSQLIQACKTTGYASVDFETSGTSIYNDGFYPTILSVCFEPGTAYSIPLKHSEMPSDHPWREWLTIFGREVIENSDIVKLMWNAKFDNQIFHKYHIYHKGTMIDGMLSKYLLDENRPNGLKDMVRRYLPQFSDYEKSLKDEDEKSSVKWDQIPLQELCRYGCLDVDCTFRLCLFFEKRLIDLNMYHILRHFYMPMSRVIQEIEEHGMRLDEDFNKKLLVEYKEKIDKAHEDILSLPKVKKFQKKYSQKRVDEYIETLEEEIQTLTDPKDLRKITLRQNKIAQITNGVFTTKKEQDLIRPININSNKDLPALLYSEDGFGFVCPSLTEAGKPSTSEDTLTELRLSVKNPDSSRAIFLDKLLELRFLNKMYTTYIQGWSESVCDDHRLHGTFLLHGTTSNRLSSKNPNMQQVPKTSVDPNIKRQIIPEPGTLYLTMDFSQAELRIMSYLSKDDSYLQAFREGKDPHLTIAAQKYHVPYEEAEAIYENEAHPDYKTWKVRRKQAKQIVFGLIYGIQSKLLSEKLSEPKEGIIVTPKEATEMMDDFFSQHPKIKKYMDKQSRVLVKQGYIESLFGTRRRLPEVYSDDQAEVAYAIRLSCNFPCQSAASNMTEFGAILNYWDMKNGRFPNIRSVCTVHDSFYYNVIPKYLNSYTVYRMWETFRNPETKKYFGFQIDTIDMSMDFQIGRTMAEELPFTPGYDYSKMLREDFSVDEYLEEHKRVKESFKAAGLEMTPHNYPKMFPEEIAYWENIYGKL